MLIKEQRVPLYHKRTLRPFQSRFVTLLKVCSTLSCGSWKGSCRNLCYIREYPTRLKANHRTSVLAAYSWERDLWPLPRHQTRAWKKRKGSCSTLHCFFRMCLPVTVSHSMTCQRGLRRSEPAAVSFSTLRGGEAPCACQRTSPRTWRLLSMLHITGLKGYTLKTNKTIYMISLRCFLHLYYWY